jgi:peroxisomal 2,4-dienoyl-CoA reductase
VQEKKPNTTTTTTTNQMTSTNKSDLEQEFIDAQRYIQQGPPSNNSSNEIKLKFYSLFKQATEGPMPSNLKRPGLFDLVARAKYDAWKKLGQMTREEAIKNYLKTLDEVSPGWRQWIKQNPSLEQKESGIISPSPTNSQRAHAASKSIFTNNFLCGKVAIVTGGGSGICKAITESLMRHGCHTVIISRNFEKLKQAAQELNNLVNNGTTCIPISADVRDYARLERAFDEALERVPNNRLDILINGAAGNFMAPVEKLSSNAFKTVMEIDALGTFHSSKLAYEKYMKEHGGVIINLSMTLHLQGAPLQVHAGAAKSAIDAMTRHMAVEFGPRKVRVNAIAIGPIENTEGFSKLMPHQYLTQFQRLVPLQRWGRVEDIANATLYLVSDAASYVTGAILVVDGGSVFTTGGFGYPDMLGKSKL